MAQNSSAEKKEKSNPIQPTKRSKMQTQDPSKLKARIHQDTHQWRNLHLCSPHRRPKPALRIPKRKTPTPTLIERSARMPPRPEKPSRNSSTLFEKGEGLPRSLSSRAFSQSSTQSSSTLNPSLIFPPRASAPAQTKTLSLLCLSLLPSLPSLLPRPFLVPLMLLFRVLSRLLWLLLIPPRLLLGKAQGKNFVGESEVPNLYLIQSRYWTPNFHVNQLLKMSLKNHLSVSFPFRYSN